VSRLPFTDFSAIIRTLGASGLNHSTIARKLHVSPAAVCHWSTGERRPNFTNGTQLLELAERVKPKG